MDFQSLPKHGFGVVRLSGALKDVAEGEIQLGTRDAASPDMVLENVRCAFRISCFFGLLGRIQNLLLRYGYGPGCKVRRGKQKQKCRCSEAKKYLHGERSQFETKRELGPRRNRFAPVSAGAEFPFADTGQDRVFKDSFGFGFHDFRG
jgi:hypothetical protein